MAKPEVESYQRELEDVLPADLLGRERVVRGAALHLALLREENRDVNLTRVIEPREAAIKHVFDSLAPLARFAGLGRVLDIGSGAGFPGIPLALALPDTRVILAESAIKKAIFLEDVVEALELDNLSVETARGEEILARTKVDAATARAVGTIPKLLRVLRPARRKLHHLLLYKGPAAEREIEEAKLEARRFRYEAEITFRYELPDNCGTRCLVEYRTRQFPRPR